MVMRKLCAFPKSPNTSQLMRMIHSLSYYRYISLVDSGATKNTQISDTGLLLHIRGKGTTIAYTREQGETKLCKGKTVEIKAQNR